MEHGHGGRITLRKRDEHSESVDYECELSTPDTLYRTHAQVVFADGKVSFRADGAEAPEWLLEMARTTLRTAWHAHRAGTAWPRRLTRWREAPGASEPKES